MEPLLFPAISIFVCTLLFLLFFIRVWSISPKPQHPQHPRPPGPWKLPIIGSMHHLAGQVPFRALRDLSRTHGDLMLIQIGQVDFAVASSAEVAEEIMKNQDPNFASRPPLALGKFLCYANSDIVLSPYGPYWKQLRRLCHMELFSAKRIQSFASIRKEETLELMRDIARATTTETPINLSKKLFHLSTAIISRAAFGEQSKHTERFFPIAKEAMDLFSGFSIADTFPSVKLLGLITGLRFRMQRIHRQADEILRSIIKEHEVKMMTKNGQREEEVEDLVDVLLRIKDEPGLDVPMTKDNVKAVIFDMFLGGTETSSNVIEWAMAELLRNPKMMEKAQNEVREAVEGKTCIEEEINDVDRLKYISSVIKETMRLHPPFTLIPRLCNKTSKVLRYEIKADTRVLINAWAINTDPQYWDDAESFKPERFEDESIAFKGGSSYFTFGAGRRKCPGGGFGLAVVNCTLAQLLLYFDWKLPDGMKPEELDMSEGFGIASSRKTELKVLAIPYFPVPTIVSDKD